MIASSPMEDDARRRWLGGELYFTSGPGTRKARNLAANPACTFSVGLEGIDVVLDGEATRVTDLPTLERLARLYREEGWPAEVADVSSPPRLVSLIGRLLKAVVCAWRHTGTEPMSSSPTGT